MSWLNAVANACGRLLLAPIAVLPGWLSATLVAAVTGVLLLVIFKYTSNQRAIKRARDEIKANLLALKLFKDSTWVLLTAQRRILRGAGKLFVLSLVPMLVMMVPVILFMAQLATWYQARPLRVGEETIVSLKLNGEVNSPWPEVRLEPNEALEIKTGPVRVASERAIYWDVTARRPGGEPLVFRVAEERAQKELAIGDGYVRLSPLRPGWNWSDALLYPDERPFRPNEVIQSIAVDYPPRDAWMSGTKGWIIYWFLASMVAAFVFRPFLNVNI